MIQKVFFFYTHQVVYSSTKTYQPKAAHLFHDGNIHMVLWVKPVSDVIRLFLRFLSPLHSFEFQLLICIILVAAYVSVCLNTIVIVHRRATAEINSYRVQETHIETQNVYGVVPIFRRKRELEFG